MLEWSPQFGIALAFFNFLISCSVGQRKREREREREQNESQHTRTDLKVLTALLQFARSSNDKTSFEYELTPHPKDEV